MPTRLDIFVGGLYTNSDGCIAKVIEYAKWNNVTIEFQDKHRFKKVVRADSIKNGSFRNPYYKSLLGVGYIGVGRHKPKENGKKSQVYIHWTGMMTRGYSVRYTALKPSYMGCTVCEEWHNLQTFADWLEEQIGFGEGFHLDKDLLLKGNKIYSPETCVLVPNNLNVLLTSAKSKRGVLPIGVSYHKIKGKYCSSVRNNNVLKHLGVFSTPEDAFYAYKEAKESHIKELANQYKDQIDLRACNALMSWEVNIDD